MKAIIRYVLLTALRDKLFSGLFFLMLLTMFLSSFLGSTALVEGDLMKTVYASGAVRIIANIGLILFICFSIRRSFENKEIEFMLSHPISRTSLVLSYLISFFLLALLVVIVLSLAMLLFFSTNKLGLFYWAVSLFGEILIVISYAVFSSLILKSAVVSVLSTFAFYFVSRMMGFFVAMISFTDPYMSATSGNRNLELILKAISVLIPRLDLFAKSDMVIYGVKDMNIMWIYLAQIVIYISLLSCLTIFDFRKKQF